MNEQLLEISIKINILESLTRILLEAIREDNNLKKFNTSNLAKVVLQEVITIKNNLNSLEIRLGI